MTPYRLVLAAVLLFIMAPVARGQAVAVARHAVDGPAQLQFEFAAGMVTGRVPAEWYVGERNVGREVQLIAAPEEPKKGEVPQECIVLTVHAQSGKWDCRALLQRRVDELQTSNGMQVEGEAAATWGRFLGRRISIVSVATDPPLHLSMGLVESPWGHVEWRIQGRDADWVRQWEATMVSRWTIRAPRLPAAPTDPALRAAASIMGSWKAFRSRLRLMPSGRIELVWDKPHITEVGTPETVLVGEFRAAEDLLYVTWTDGSRRSYRWRRDGAWLLLTDHEGRVMQLRALYE